MYSLYVLLSHDFRELQILTEDLRTAKLDSKVPEGKITGFGGVAKGNLYRLTVNLNGIHYIELPILFSVNNRILGKRKRL